MNFSSEKQHTQNRITQKVCKYSNVFIIWRPNYYNIIKITTMAEGTVKFFNSEKGYGFITDDSNSTDIFVHVSGLNQDVEQGDKVSFETSEGKKGLNAVNVSIQ